MLVSCKVYGRRVILTTQTKSSKFIEYMKIHLISLNQDFDGKYNTETKIHIQGQIDATRHLLSVATDIMNDDFQGKGY